MTWGTPTAGAMLQHPSSCSEHHVVWYNTNDTYIKLTGSSGCGILIVEGDLDIYGGFSWYGPVIVTGLVTLTGGGNKNITGRWWPVARPMWTWSGATPMWFIAVRRCKAKPTACRSSV